MHFDKILVANRGEIACRVIKTAKKLGIKSVAVFSDADRHSKHVDEADEAYYIGKSEVQSSYLNTKSILRAIKDSGAQAVHPGYGFLSENAEFADVLHNENIVFIGAPASAIRSMGSKSEAKRLMSKANVPCVPWYGESQDANILEKEAQKIGFPVLIKAVKGGGGKGMRVCNHLHEFQEKLASSKRESLKSFGDDEVLVEKYIQNPRHIEVQVFADNHGEAVYLFERDCSLQRRYQKIIEEAPANVTPQFREMIGQKAVDAAKAVDYRGAGTVEFIVENDDFYFMEMNTRLQVEHPVTEMITNLDLVEWQINVALGHKLPEQNKIFFNGHSFEARIYAEDPYNNFYPSVGKIKHLQFPNVRTDTGVRKGDEIKVYYDPMIAKIVVWDSSRQKALNLLQSALDNVIVCGVKTNVDFLRTLSKTGLRNLDTGFLERHPELMKQNKVPCFDAVVSAAIGSILNIAISKELQFLRMDKCEEELEFVCLGLDLKVSLEITRTEIKGKCLDYEFQVSRNTSSLINNNLIIDLQNRILKTTFVQNNDYCQVFGPTIPYSLEFYKKKHNETVKETKSKQIYSPMPCKITHVFVSQNQMVKKHQPMLILEAMKMEQTISAPFDGTIKDINVKIDEIINQNHLILEFK